MSIMDVNITKKQVAFVFAIFICLLSLSAFLYMTGIILNPLVLILISLFVVFPFSKDSPFAKRMVFLISFLFVGWLLADLGFALIPFIAAFLIAYLLDPLINQLDRKKIPRWLSAIVMDVLLISLVSTIAIFIFPMIFNQLDDAINKISQLVNSVSSDITGQKVYSWLSSFGIREENVKYIAEKEIIPRLEGLLSGIMMALMRLLTNLSTIATQLINIILIPILLFYFIKDFHKLTGFIDNILDQKNKKLLFDIKRIGKILRKYIGWQITAAAIVATVCSFFFSIFSIPYPIVLGLLCGLLNPIPYLGIFASFLICIITIFLNGSPDIASQILVVGLVIGIMHFINAYFLEPNIAGKMVGIHPILLIASLFVFGSMFGFLGLMIAVPLTATLMMYFEDWLRKSKLISSKK